MLDSGGGDILWAGILGKLNCYSKLLSDYGKGAILMQESYRLGIDIGGTFTDIALFNETTREVTSLKVPSSRTNPGKPVLEGVSKVITGKGISPQAIKHVVHGCTIATNAIIERTGVKTGLILTKGCKGMLEIGRFETVSLLDLMSDKLVALVPKGLVKEVRGRILHSGEEVEPLCEEDVLQAVNELSREDVKSIAICLLNSYINPQHENRVKHIIEKAMPEAIVLSATEIWPEMGEYERAYIAILDGYIKPLMDAYLSSVEEGLRDIGIKAPIYVPKLNGGVTTTSSSRENPVATVTSGPTAGVQGAAFIAKSLGISKAISLDIGGTSADFSCIEDGEPAYSTATRVGGFPVTMPSVWLRSIGAGGGAIAWVDPTGILKVGPQSAGADPGPICYGKGGTQPTVTDAYLICGYLSPDTPFPGEIKLDKNLAEQAISSIASKLGVTTLEAAEGILLVVNAMLEREVSALTSKRGFDRRETSLIAFGGACPTHAHWLLDELKLQNIIIPPYPGTLSALGGVLSDVKQDAVKSLSQDLDNVNIDKLRDDYHEMKEKLTAWLKGEGISAKQSYILMSADMKYRRQAYTLDIPVSAAMLNEGTSVLKRAFHDTHERIYKHHDEKAIIEVVNLRATIIGTLPKVELKTLPEAEEKTPKASRTTEMYYKGRKHAANVYQRSALRHGHVLSGPAIIEQEDTTTILPAGFTAEVDKLGCVIIEKGDNRD